MNTRSSKNIFSPLSSTSRRPHLSNIYDNNTVESTYTTKTKVVNPKTNRIIFAYPNKALNIAVLQRNNNTFLQNNLTPRSSCSSLNTKHNNKHTRINSKINQMNKQFQLTRNGNNKESAFINDEFMNGFKSQRYSSLCVNEIINFSPTKRSMIRSGLFKRLKEKKMNEPHDLNEKPTRKEDKVRRNNKFECDSYINDLRCSSTGIKHKLYSFY